MSEFLSNEDESLTRSLERWLRRSTVVRWAVAYIRTSIIDRLSAALSDFESRGGTLQILTGSGQHFTQAEALERLQTVAGVEIRVYAAPGVTFHPKLYLFHNGQQGTIVGSANLSGGAFQSNVEVAAEITDVTDPAFILRADQWFDQVWGRAKPLTSTMLEWFRRNERSDDEEDFARLVAEEPEAYTPASDLARFAREELYGLGQLYTNAEMSNTAHVSTQGGIRYRGSLHRGIERCVIITGSDKASFYRDEQDFTGGRLRYTGEGRSGDQELTRGNRALSEQAMVGFPLHVFSKEGVDRYRYMGQFRVLVVQRERQPGEDGIVRWAYVFDMQRLD